VRTTVDLDESLVARAMELTHARTKTAVLERGLRALIDIEARILAVEQGGTLPELEMPRRGGSVAELDPSLGITRNPRR
jgi:Arc/MetJ family transcription regulator